MFSFGTSIRLQAASLCFIILVMIDFCRSERLKLLTTRIFGAILGTSALYMFADILTVYTISNMAGTAFNEIAHRIFYLLMLTVVFLVSAYVEFAGNARNKSISIPMTVLWVLPYIVCVIGMMTAGIEYICDENGVYSRGAAVNFLYAGIAVYIVIIFIETFRYKSALPEKKRLVLRLQLLIWTVITLVQHTNPYMLLSGLAISLNVTALYFSFENPNENIDKTTGAFNASAFSQVFFEAVNCIGRKPVRVAVLAAEDEDIIVSSIGFYRFELLMSKAAEDMRYMFMSPVYRIRSNMFAVIAPESDTGFEDRLIKLERKLSYPYRLGDASIELKAHAVTIRCPEITTEPADIAELAAFCSDNCSGFVREVSSETAEKKKRSETLSRMLIDAVANDGFEVVYQPIYSTEKKAFLSSEALIRMKDKETIGFVSPEEFIPLAEKNGYIIKIGEIVFEKVCAAMRKMRDMGLRVDYIEVNLSALQSIDETVPKSFSEIMKKYGISPESINLEITETTAVESASMLERNMNRFRQMGCSFSMDDFGTGYSNLSKMAEVNYDLVKFDKSLIWPSFGEDKKEKSLIILTNTVNMVSALGAHIVAEGVETEEMVNGLTEMGVHYLQGYYFSRPISEEAYIEFIKEKQAG